MERDREGLYSSTEKTLSQHVIGEAANKRAKKPVQIPMG